MHDLSHGNKIHELPAAGECAQRQAASDRLRIRRKVRHDPIPLLGAAQRQSEAGDHLVENEQGAVAGGDVAEKLEEAGFGGDAAAVAKQRFANDCGDFAALISEEPLDAFSVVPFGDYDIVVRPLSGTRAYRYAIRVRDVRRARVIAH